MAMMRQVVLAQYPQYFRLFLPQPIVSAVSPLTRPQFFDCLVPDVAVEPNFIHKGVELLGS